MKEGDIELVFTSKNNGFISAGINAQFGGWISVLILQFSPHKNRLNRDIV
jgi:hypothetical protein